MAEYKTTEAQRLAIRRYQNSPNGQANLRKRKRKYRQTEKGKAEHRRNQLKYQKKMPRQIRYARNVVADRLKRGLMEREPCKVCGDPNTEAHHPNYSQPELVDWFCRLHHLNHHGRMD